MAEEKKDPLESARGSMGYEPPKVDPEADPEKPEEGAVEGTDETPEPEAPEGADPEKPEEGTSEEDPAPEGAAEEGTEEDPPEGEPHAEGEPYQPTKAERAIFKQLGDFGKQLKEVVDTVGTLSKKGKEDAKDDIEDTIQTALTELKKEASEKGSDPEFIDKLFKTFSQAIYHDLEKRGIGKSDLPAEVKESLKLLETLQKERLESKDREKFDSEWNGLIPSIKKLYPNADPKLIAQARKRMWEISHSDAGGRVAEVKGEKVVVGYPLDVLLFKNAKDFEALLKVAPKKKSTEAGGKDVPEEGELSVEDTKPENMTPQKAKRLKQRVASIDGGGDGIESLPT